MSGSTVLCIIIGAVLLCVAVPAMRFFHNAGNILSYILSALKSTGAVERPKIRSLSSAGDLFLDKIKRDFPEYNPAMVLNRVKKDARIYLQSAKEGHTLFREGVSDSFRERLAYSLPADVKGGIEVYNAALSDYDDRGRDRILVFQAAAEYWQSEIPGRFPRYDFHALPFRGWHTARREARSPSRYFRHPALPSHRYC